MVLGFSPWNDLHLFDAIDQSDITECCFYYHGDTAAEEIKRLLPRLCSSDGLRFISVKDFWEKQHEKRIKFPTPNDASKWYDIANMFAKSLISQNEALSQYNKLTADQRSKIEQQFQSYDELRRKRITARDESAESCWETSIMVDAYIIAAGYDIDPVTVIMYYVVKNRKRLLPYLPDEIPR